MVEWCGHRVEGIPVPDVDGRWRLIVVGGGEVVPYPGTPKVQWTSNRRQQHTLFMVSGVIAAVLKEQFADHIVLSDSTSLPLPEGLIVRQFGSGTRVTITYIRESGDGDGGGGGGEMVVQAVTRA